MSRPRIIVAISVQLKVMLEINFSGFLLNVKGSLLKFCLWKSYRSPCQNFVKTRNHQRFFPGNFRSFQNNYFFIWTAASEFADISHNLYPLLPHLILGQRNGES